MTSPSIAPTPRHRWSALVLDASSLVLRVERQLLLGLMALLVALILLNVTTRYMGMPIYWVDEAAVYSVVWLTFVGGSAMTRLRMDFAVTLLTDHLGPHLAHAAKICAGVGVLLFGAAMLVMCWIWFDPVGVTRYGFDAREYAANSFNFIYTERTQTLNWPTWLLQTIMPIFSATLTLHAAANLIEDLGWQPKRIHTGFATGNAEATVN